MAQTIRLHFPDLSAAANAISKLALERGAPDNATVALLMTNDER
jgi:serine/threonine protein phosphatase PrpC